jgi:hypothetical protein
VTSVDKGYKIHPKAGPARGISRKVVYESCSDVITDVEDFVSHSLQDLYLVHLAALLSTQIPSYLLCAV